MDAPLPPRLLIASVVVAGLCVASGAVFFSATEVDPIGPLFHQALTGQIIVGLLAWSLLALGLRWLLLGRLPKMPISFVPGLIWGGFRIALLVATVIVIVVWLAALVLGLAVATTFFKALVLILMFSAFTGIAGGAFINSILAMGELRRRRAA